MKPAVIVILKGVEILPATLRQIRKDLPGAVLININHDDYFSRAGGNRFPDLKEIIACYDYYFPTKLCNVDELTDAGARRVHYLPFGYDPCRYFPVVPSREEFWEYRSQLVFIGNHAPARGSYLAALTDYQLSIWGDGWKRFANPRRIKRRARGLASPDRNMEFSKIVNSGSISLNFFRKENRDTLNPRTFELPACGGFVLSERSDELLRYFKEGKEVVTFSTPEELREKADYYLNHERQREKIARAGWERARKGRHTIRDRVGELLSVCGCRPVP